MTVEHIRSLLNLPESVFDDEAARLRLRFRNVILEIRSNDRLLIDRVREYHRCYVEEDDASGEAFQVVHLLHIPGFRSSYEMRDFVRSKSGRKIKEEFIDLFEGRLVRKKKYGIEAYIDGVNHIMVGDIRENIHQVALFLNVVFARMYLAGRGYLLLNVAAISDGDNVISLASMPNTGTSGTILFDLIERKFKLTAFDRLMVRSRDDLVQAIGYPLHPRVHPGSVLHHDRIMSSLSIGKQTRYRQLGPSELWALDESVQVDVDRIYGEHSTQLFGTLESLYILEWEPESRFVTSFDELSTDELLKMAPVYYKDLGVFDLNNTRGERVVSPDLGHLNQIFNNIRKVRVRGRMNIEKLVQNIRGRRH